MRFWSWWLSECAIILLIVPILGSDDVTETTKGVGRYTDLTSILQQFTQIGNEITMIHRERCHGEKTVPTILEAVKAMDPDLSPDGCEINADITITAPFASKAGSSSNIKAVNFVPLFESLIKLGVVTHVKSVALPASESCFSWNLNGFQKPGKEPSQIILTKEGGKCITTPNDLDPDVAYFEVSSSSTAPIGTFTLTLTTTGTGILVADYKYKAQILCSNTQLNKEDVSVTFSTKFWMESVDTSHYPPSEQCKLELSLEAPLPCTALDIAQNGCVEKMQLSYYTSRCESCGKIKLDKIELSNIIGKRCETKPYRLAIEETPSKTNFRNIKVDTISSDSTRTKMILAADINAAAKTNKLDIKLEPNCFEVLATGSHEWKVFLSKVYQGTGKQHADTTAGGGNGRKKGISGHFAALFFYSAFVLLVMVHG